MKITENSIPHCGTAEQGIAEEEALKKGMEAKSKEFLEKGSEVSIVAEINVHLFPHFQNLLKFQFANFPR